MAGADGPAARAAGFARVKSLFDAVADLPDDEASRARLAELGATADEVAQVLALVARDRAAVTHFSAPLAAVVAGTSAPELKAGERLGAWVLRAELGHGGMGQVFLAERADGLYEQHAAIKLLRGFAGEAALAQLARERRILATLNHPHIARLLDGGTTPLGRPYLVMEYVAGRRIDEWCAQGSLPLAARLLLFDQVCQAVAHAHRQLVVHCDIKPGNVLVGDDGRAMLLDFGIAQLQGREGNDTVSLTPRYASPEQLAGAPATSASDVFSLGRLLGELLEAAPDAARRADEWRAIVARAVAADPAARYASVEALREDLQRWSTHRPLRALPRGAGYVTRKLLRRRWPWALAAAGALLLSVGFVARLVQERDRALLAETQARQQAAATAQVSDFLVAIFEGADPRRGGRPDIGAITLVDQGRDRVDDQLRTQPALQSTMKGTLARVYENVGRPREAVALYEQAVALERRPDVARPLREAELLSRQAVLLANINNHAQALAPARRALELLTPRVAPDSLEMADARNTLGWVLARNGQVDEAQTHLEAALQVRVQRLGPDHLDVAGTRHNLGMLENYRDRPPAAEAQFRAALALKQAQLPPGHLSVLNTQQALAAALGQQQKFEEALPLLEQIVAGYRTLTGPGTEQTALAEHELAVVQRDSGRTTEALANYRRSMQTYVGLMGPRSMEVAVSLNNIGGAENSLGDPAAERSLRESLAIRRERQLAGDASIARAEAVLARWLLARGRVDEARPLVAQAGATRAAKLAPEHGERVDSELLQAQLALADGRLAQAEAALLALESREATLRTSLRVERWALLGQLRSAQGRPAEAAGEHAKALKLHLEKTGPRHPDTARRQLALAQAQWQAGDVAAARASLAAAQPTLQAHHPQSPQRAAGARLAAELVAAR